MFRWFINYLGAVVISIGVAQADPQFVYSDDVNSQTRKNIEKGILAGDKLFRQKLGVKFNTKFTVLASGKAGFIRANTPQRFYYPDCNGGYANHRHLVICTQSEAFNRSQFQGGLKLQQQVIALHEYVHVLQAELTGGKIDGPAWLTEGFAEHMVLLYKAQRRIITQRKELAWQRQQARKHPATLASLANRRNFNSNPYASGYGMIAVAELENRAGLKAFKDFWSLQGKGTSWRTAFKQSFGLSIDEFYEQFKL